MSVSVDCEVSNIQVYQTCGNLRVDLTDLKLSESMSAEQALNEFGKGELLDAIGGLGDWIDAGNVCADDVADWLRDQGYVVYPASEEQENG